MPFALLLHKSKQKVSLILKKRQNCDLHKITEWNPGKTFSFHIAPTLTPRNNVEEPSG